MHPHRHALALPALLLGLLCTAALAAPAEPQSRLAVLEFDNPQQVKIDRTYFSDLARGAVQKRLPQLFVMTRESTDALLQANGKSLADCTGECEVEVGRKLGADFIVSGRITQIGSRLLVTLRLFSTADGRLLDSEEARGKSQDELLDEADKAVARLVEPLAHAIDGSARSSAAPATASASSATPPSQAAPAPAPAAASTPTPAPVVAPAPPPPPPSAVRVQPASAAPAEPSSAAASAPLVAAPTGPSWAPFEGSGNYLVQTTSNGGKETESRRREGGFEQFAGVRAHYDEEEAGAADAPTVTRTYYASTAKGLEMLGARTFSGGGGPTGYRSEGLTLYSPPLLLVPKSSSKGATWAQDTVMKVHTKTWIAGRAPVENDMEMENSIRGEATGEQSVTVPGGTFRCKVLREDWTTRSQSSTYSSKTHITSTIWFSPSVGIARMDNEGESSFHMKDAEPKTSKTDMRTFVKEAHFTKPSWFTSVVH